jgi:hypothetical protein
MHIITIDLNDNTLVYKGSKISLNCTDNSIFTMGYGDKDSGTILYEEYSVVVLGKVITLTINDKT